MYSLRFTILIITPHLFGLHNIGRQLGYITPIIPAEIPEHYSLLQPSHIRDPSHYLQSRSLLVLNLHGSPLITTISAEISEHYSLLQPSHIRDPSHYLQSRSLLVLILTYSNTTVVAWCPHFLTSLPRFLSLLRFLSTIEVLIGFNSYIFISNCYCLVSLFPYFLWCLYFLTSLFRFRFITL